MNFSREMIVRNSRKCNGCECFLRKGTKAYSMPDGIYCLDCKNRVEEEILKQLTIKVELTDEDIERMNEETNDSKPRKPVNTNNKNWEFEGD